MTTRRPLTRAQRVKVFDASKGICSWCRLKIQVAQPWDADHVIPLWAGGPDDIDNMAPIHLEPCHREKTGIEATQRGKENAIRAKFLGIPKPGKKLPAGRNSGIRKKLNGQVVIRTTQAEEHQRVMAQRQIGGEAQ